jgi:ComF family protein
MDALAGLLLCPVCRSDWSRPSGCCRACGSSLLAPIELPRLCALGYYRGSLAAAVRAYKFQGVRRLAGVFADGLAQRIVLRGWRPELVSHVPLHPNRRRSRGFDQAELLARSLAGRLGVRYRAVLQRTRATPQQARLGAQQRRGNVRDAFRVVAQAPSAVLLVDDVLTTGATLSACRSALEEAGVARVLFAVVALAPRQGRADERLIGGPGTETPGQRLAVRNSRRRRW